MLLYAVTIFLSAFLLFQVQPLIAKMILPWFGGSAAVWNAVMLFFQLLLLGGYAYAHCSIRFLRAKSQVVAHIALLVLSCAILPILPSARWKPTEVGDPTLRIFVLLIVTVGLPYFLLSSTSPLLQAWYVRRSGSKMPYRFFALSNFGSMLALISYPFLVEPRLTSRQQAFTWTFAYIGFVLLCAATAWWSRDEAAPAMVEEEASEPAPRPRLIDMAQWIGLAGVASVLLFSISTHLSQNVAPIPFLWVLPLALYLATFMIAFEGDRVYHRGVMFVLLIPAIYYMAKDLYVDSGNLHIRTLIPVFSIGLFLCCMFCHGELARRRPAPKYLTLFYLMVSLGGALGGIFVALIAPRIFSWHFELPLAIGACAIIAGSVMWESISHPIFKWVLRIPVLLAVGLLCGYLGNKEHENIQGYRLVARNFYGVLRIRDDLSTSDDEYSQRTLFNGTINHGSQVLDQELRYKATTYYGEWSGVGRAIRALQKRGAVRVGVVGLGAGVLANYGRAGDFYRIFEINPLVEKIAQTDFTFYPHSPADKRILMGDARLTLERLADLQLDLLAVDAFSSDAIPIHLLTREALAVYFRHLKPDGVLALHISNRYLDLEPVCARGAELFGKQAMTVYDEGDEAPYLSSSSWVLVTGNTEFFLDKTFDDAFIKPAKAPAGFRAWTDDYSNVFQIFKRD